MNADQQKALRAPFEPAEIGKLPRLWCGKCRESRTKSCPDHPAAKCRECGQKHSTAALHLSYVGHAETTDRLLSVDPAWNWEGLGENGAPVLDNGGLWIRLTVCGVTRLGYGDAQGKTGGDAIKECIGDAIRNAAMRFGVALDLWRKSGNLDMQVEQQSAEEPKANPRKPSAPPADTNDADAARNELRAVCTAKGVPLQGAVVEFRKRHGVELKDSTDAAAIRVLSMEFQDEAEAAS